MSNTKVNIGQKARVEIIWNVLPVDRTPEKEENIRVMFANKYGIPKSHVRVTPNFINITNGETTSLNKDTIQNIHDPKFQQSLFPIYLKEHGIEDYDLDEINKIDSQINALIDYNAYEKGRRYTLKWLDWSNFLSYGQINHFDFTGLNGLVLLNSKPANQGGKSTFAYDLLHFLFFGRTTSGKAKTLDKLFNDHLNNETELKVEGCIEIDGIDYVVRRTLTRPAATRKNRSVTQKIEYFRMYDNGSLEALEESDNLRESTNIKTTQAIKEAIGNERDFDMVISANADNLKELISLKETDRGRLLSRWIGLLPLEDKDVLARDKWNHEININRYSTRYDRQTLATEIENLKAQINDYEAEIKKNEKQVKESEKKIEDFNETRDTLIASKKQIKDELTNIDIETLKATMDRIAEEGKNKTLEKEKYENTLKSYGDITFSEDTYKQKVKEKETFIGIIADLKNQISNLKTTNKNLKESEYCPVCKRKFENVDNTAAIEENEKKIQDLITDGINAKKLMDETVEEINSLEKKREQYNQKNRLELLISKIEVEISNKRNDYIQKKQLMKDIKDNSAAIEENNRIDTSLNIVKQNIRTEETIKYRASETIVSFKKDIEASKKEITEKEIIINHIIEEAKIEKNWKTYLMLIGKDGISKMVLRNALPIINSELHRFLSGVCDFDIEVELNDKNDVDFTMVCEDGIRRNLSAGSGFEQTAAALALRVVLANMSALSKPPFILLDEVLGGVADENYDNMRKLYDRIAENYSFVLQITHLKDIWDWHNQFITVVKENYISHIEINNKK